MKESELTGCPKLITFDCTKKIMEQMQKNICKIEISENIRGTGFFCKIPFPSQEKELKVLITNNHLINEYTLKKNNFKIIINIEVENKPKELNLNNRLIYTNKEKYDTTIIEIKKDDEINNYMELDDNIYNDIIFNDNKNNKYKDKTIYILQYPEGELSVSYGILLNIYQDKEHDFKHKCYTRNGSSGSPILNLNNKIIGIHKEGDKNYNKGTFLNYPIKEFIQKFKEKKGLELIQNKISNPKKIEQVHFDNLNQLNVLIKLNNVINRFLPINESVKFGLEREPNIEDFILMSDLGYKDTFDHTFLVFHKITNAKYTIKAVDKRNKNNSKECPYFKNGIEELYKINHKNLAKIYGHFEDNSYCYFLTEYFPKENMNYNILLNNRKKLPSKICSFIIRDLISAVYYLHNMNPPIIHRYIKPENVNLDDNLTVKITDFGWNDYMIGLNQINLRKSIPRTSIYSAPEILKEISYDESVDLWSIGVLLFYLITSFYPFQVNDITNLAINNNNLRINWPIDIDSDAKDLISKILKLEPKNRISLEGMMNHPFITKFTPDAPRYLVKPNTSVKYGPFIFSRDDPKSIY